MDRLWRGLRVVRSEQRLAFRLLRFLPAVRLFSVVCEILGEVPFFRVQGRYELPVFRSLFLFKFRDVQLFLRGSALVIVVLRAWSFVSVLSVQLLVLRVLEWVVRVVLLRDNLVLRYGLAWVLFH